MVCCNMISYCTVMTINHIEEHYQHHARNLGIHDEHEAMISTKSDW